MTDFQEIEIEVMKREEELKELESDMADARSKLHGTRKEKNDTKSRVDEVSMRLRKRKAVFIMKFICLISTEAGQTVFGQ